MKTNVGKLEYSVLVNGIERGQFNNWNKLCEFVTKIKTRPITLNSTEMLVSIRNNMTTKQIISDRWTPMPKIKEEIDKQG